MTACETGRVGFGGCDDNWDLELAPVAGQCAWSSSRGVQGLLDGRLGNGGVPAARRRLAGGGLPAERRRSGEGGGRRTQTLALLLRERDRGSEGREKL